VSTKHDVVEDRAQLAARIDEAARHFPVEQLALSTQCGLPQSRAATRSAPPARRQSSGSSPSSPKAYPTDLLLSGQ
jgi:5-methyltetrahydropteroyltriglutamate--homocysteine methyltransferase